MGYEGQATRGLALRRDWLQERDKREIQRIAARLREIYESFEPSEHVIPVRMDEGRHLISVAVDGGDNLIAPEAREIATGFIRVAAASPDIKELPPPLELVVKGFHLFSEDRGEFARRAQAYVQSLFRDERIFRDFSEKTGVSSSDLGTHYCSSVPALVGILRDVAEWAYLVHLASRFSEIKMVLVKDGRLAQVGVNRSFLEKLVSFFRKERVFIVGVSKSSKLVGDKFAISIMLRWLEDYDVPVVIRVPDELMNYVYSSSRQWNPEDENSMVIGRRYLMRLRKKDFTPMESAVVFDVPNYMVENRRALNQISATLWRHRSILYGGSIDSVVEAHDRASLGKTSVNRLEWELWRLIEREVFRDA